MVGVKFAGVVRTAGHQLAEREAAGVGTRVNLVLDAADRSPSATASFRL